MYINLLCCLFTQNSNNEKKSASNDSWNHLSTNSHSLREKKKSSECQRKDWYTTRLSDKLLLIRLRERKILREDRVTRNIIHLICCTEPRSFVSTRADILPIFSPRTSKRKQRNIFRAENCTIICLHNKSRHSFFRPSTLAACGSLVDKFI